ncbi:hypothetical protein KRR26_08610 [Corallococcus sp. M34]|uniref:hypothetical protein n=1 Tax=Citreicoccus inhibens TaxID=2849499 RepID=UPI0011C38A95|nr:hypothetical protein [Citreicoccus inhibens]MBU8895664.1 hypothetical protein [Citreicoccus inhibens]
MGLSVPRLCLALLAAAAGVVACDPIVVKPLDVPMAKFPPNGGGSSHNPVGDVLDGGWAEPVPPGLERRPQALPAWGACIGGWQSMELARGTISAGFTLGAGDEGLYAYSRPGGIKTGNVSSDPWLEEPGFRGTPHLAGLKVDASHALHLLYDARAEDSELSAPSLVYAGSNAGGRWRRSLVGTGTAMAFDLDSRGVTHVLYVSDAQGGELYYANDRLGVWTATDLGVATDMEGAVLRVDGLGNSHVVYSTLEDSRLHYLTNASGAWVDEEVRAYGYGQSLDLDVMGVPHVTFSDGDLWYGVRRDGAWSLSRIRTGADAQTTLAVDQLGMAHLVGADSQGTFVLYMTNAKGAWRELPVTSRMKPYSVNLASERLLSVDSQGRAHIVWVKVVLIDREGNRDILLQYSRQCP